MCICRMRNPAHVIKTQKQYGGHDLSSSPDRVCVCVCSAFAIVLSCSCCIAKTSQVTVDLFPVTMVLANYA